MKNQVQQSQMLNGTEVNPYIDSIVDILTGDDPITKPPKPPYCPWCRSGAHKDVRDNYAERFMKGI